MKLFELIQNQQKGTKTGVNQTLMSPPPPLCQSAGLAPPPGVSASLGALGPYSDPAHRRKTTRDATAALKTWLGEHRRNPYPSKGEKVLLAILTRMSLTQVSTWFANARRRLKKENKMTWSPRNRPGDADDEVDGDRWLTHSLATSLTHSLAHSLAH